MIAKRNRSVIPLCVLLTLLITGNVFGADKTPLKNMLPAGVVMEEGFKPGFGHPVGRVLLVEGEIVIVHAKGVKAYQAKKNLPLYKGDLIITSSKGRIRLTLKDKSVMTLAPNTRLELNESVYDPKKKNRFSFLKMAMGKTRFMIRKTSNFKRSEYKIKTPTAVVGVRGSDFIIVAKPERTEVTTFADTVLEVLSLAFPGKRPTIFRAYQKTTVERGKLPAEPEPVPLIEAEQLKREFVFSSKGVISRIGVQPVVKPAADAEGEKTPMGGTEATRELMSVGVLISTDELVDPDMVIGADETETLLVDIGDGSVLPGQLRPILREMMEVVEIESFERIEDRIDTDVIEIVSEEIVQVQELPGFPGTPE